MFATLTPVINTHFLLRYHEFEYLELAYCIVLKIKEGFFVYFNI